MLKFAGTHPCPCIAPFPNKEEFEYEGKGAESVNADLAYAVTDMRLLQVAETLRWLIADRPAQEESALGTALEVIYDARAALKRPDPPLAV